jgi:hypothetical protein
VVISTFSSCGYSFLFNTIFRYSASYYSLLVSYIPSSLFLHTFAVHPVIISFFSSTLFFSFSTRKCHQPLPAFLLLQTHILKMITVHVSAFLPSNLFLFFSLLTCIEYLHVSLHPSIATLLLSLFIYTIPFDYGSYLCLCSLVRSFPPCLSLLNCIAFLHFPLFTLQ